ncbi:GIY-YIG nuclease family protein [uncultured Imperialibacter sp.]|uniref:GIY-YIG nuclease family protein n=1 Tax=Imperialibacter sp. TaxID=2038411 RepID=UPI0030D91669|tara:strand:- start:54520 stop:54762 length:243 start_codon:yes stop_codon:yes gene_type:complete
MYYAYVLRSLDKKNFYKGHCEDLDRRLKEHNQGRTTSTARYAPWEVVYFETFETRDEAIKREKFFKTASGRRYLKSQITQ